MIRVVSGLCGAHAGPIGTKRPANPDMKLLASLQMWDLIVSVPESLLIFLLYRPDEGRSPNRTGRYDILCSIHNFQTRAS